MMKFTDLITTQTAALQHRSTAALNNNPITQQTQVTQATQATQATQS